MPPNSSSTGKSIVLVDVITIPQACGIEQIIKGVKKFVRTCPYWSRCHGRGTATSVPHCKEKARRQA